ncbi:MAG TPA: NADH-quinone oxidoreductase subunit NuoN [Rhodospirillaceae bacterium]|nr:NADH-quinone oxidoreductase subunit NuoN [Rhodospirillaceae bacterium]
MPIIDDLQHVLPELFLAVMAMALLIYGVFNGNKVTGLALKVAVGVLLLTAAIMFGFAPNALSYSFGNMLVHDSYALFFKALILTGSVGALAISRRYLEYANISRFEYPVLVLLATLGMFIMVSANSMLSLYMGLELQSLSLYILAAIQRDNARSSEAGLKYFVLGALSSGMLLFGISLIYGYTGALDFDSIAVAASGLDKVNGAVVGMVFVLAAMAFKISAAPFHIWAPDVYEGAPTSVTAFFAAVPKIAAFGLLLRLLYEPFGTLAQDWGQIIYAVSALSMIIGSFAALTQNNIKRLLAFSSIGHVGFALLDLCTGLAIGLSATVAYLVIYMIMTLGVFAVILCLNADGKMITNIDDMAGLAKTSPVLSYVLAILMFSMAGIPPMAGFFAKLYVFQAAIEGGAIYLAIIGVLCSVVSAYYYLRIIKVMFFDEGDIKLKQDFGLGRPIVMTLSSVFVLLYIISPEFLLTLVRHSIAPLILYG